jgi:hypothetical protein
MKKLLILTTLFLSIIIAQPGNSDVPSTISFQGLLTNAEGFNYVDGEYNLTFRLIRQIDQTSEQNIWEESHLVFVTNGIFSVNLGSLVTLPLIITADTELETQVGEEVLAPRQPFNSVPFALKARDAEFAGMAEIASFAENVDLSSYTENIATEGSITANNFIGDGSGLTGIPQGGINSLDDLGINATSNEINYLGGANSNIQNQLDNKININDSATPISFFSYAENNTSILADWSIIHTLLLSVENEMKLHTHAFFARVGEGAIAAQIALFDQSGNLLDVGVRSGRFPSGLASNFIDSDIIFTVPPGAYQIGLYAVGSGSSEAENILIEVKAFPVSSSNRSSSDIRHHQGTHPYEIGKPLLKF